MPLLIETGEDGGIENMVWYKMNVRSGIYLFRGSLTNFYLSEKFDLKYTDLNLLVASMR
jgi:alanine dehydrogenase